VLYKVTTRLSKVSFIRLKKRMC